jgi:hypothetical protein
MNTNALTAQNCSLFEIDAELEAAFDQMHEERETTGIIITKRVSAACSCSPNLARK